MARWVVTGGGLTALLGALACNPFATHEPVCEDVKWTLRSFESAIKTYELTSPRLPAEGWFETLTGKGLLSQSAPPRDPWGREYVYTPEADGFTLASLGADGIEGTADDQSTKNGYAWSECVPPGRRLWSCGRR